MPAPARPARRGRRNLRRRLRKPVLRRQLGPFYQFGNVGLPQDPRPAPVHPPPRTRLLFLLSAPHRRARPVPRPRRASRPGRAQLLSQLGFLLPRMQFPQRRASRRRFSPLALPPALPDRLRTQSPSPRPRRPRLRQAPPSRPPPRHPHRPQEPPTRLFL